MGAKGQFSQEVRSGSVAARHETGWGAQDWALRCPDLFTHGAAESPIAHLRLLAGLPLHHILGWGSKVKAAVISLNPDLVFQGVDFPPPLRVTYKWQPRRVFLPTLSSSALLRLNIWVEVVSLHGSPKVWGVCVGFASHPEANVDVL